MTSGRGRTARRIFRRARSEERGLKQFLYARLYDLPELNPFESRRSAWSPTLRCYRADPGLLPSTWQHGGDECTGCERSAISSPG